MKNKKKLPCIECPVLAVCIPKHKDQLRLNCDIIWKYVVEDTNPTKGMTLGTWHKSPRRFERARRREQVIEQFPNVRDITDGRDVL